MNASLKVIDFKKLFKILLFLLLLFKSFSSLSQTSDNLLTQVDTITLLKQTIRDRGSITTYGLGIVGLPSRQWCAFSFLLSMLKTNDLANLTKDSSTCLRFWSFAGLYYSNYPHINELKKYLSSDTTQLYSQAACVGSMTTVSEAVNQVDIWVDKQRTTEFLQLLEADKNRKDEIFGSIINDKDDTIFY